MGENARIAVVTGGNRGLGLETCRQLARAGLAVVLTSRDTIKGDTAALWLRREGLRVDRFDLDLEVPDSITRLAAHLEQTYGRVDVLVNNAGILPGPADRTAPDPASVFRARITDFRAAMTTNVYGPLLLAQALVPLMRTGGYGRIVNVSSGMAQLSDMGGAWAPYRTSKTALNALTRILAAELGDTNILVNAVCPGWVRTDMGGPNATRSPEEAVDTIVWLATLPDGGPSGGFFRDREPIPW